jgi:hypothetical protein
VVPGQWGRTHVSAAGGGRGGWGASEQGQATANCGGIALSASQETAVSHAGEIDCHCNNCGPVPPRQWGDRQLQWGRDESVVAAPSGGGNPNITLTPAEVLQPLQMLWHSFQGWMYLLVGKEEVEAMMAAAMSLRWQRRRVWAEEGSMRGGGRRRRMQ